MTNTMRTAGLGLSVLLSACSSGQPSNGASETKIVGGTRVTATEVLADIEASREQDDEALARIEEQSSPPC